MSNNETEPCWFARRDGTVRGPFGSDHLKRCILLGRIRLNDELSRDERRWRPLSEFPELFPEVLDGMAGPDDYQRLLAAYREADERVGERRHASGRLPSTLGTDRRRTADRRNGSWLTVLWHLYQPDPEESRPAQSVRILLLAMLIASLVLAYFSAFSR